MSDRVFESSTFGKIALRKMAPVPEGFILYYAGWLGDDPRKSEVMEVRGCQMRAAKRGKNKGKMVIRLPNTERRAYVTVTEMEELDGVRRNHV